MEPPRRLKSAIVSRIKVMASLDIAERRLPQDGVIKMKAATARRSTPSLRVADGFRREGRASTARQR